MASFTGLLFIQTACHFIYTEFNFQKLNILPTVWIHVFLYEYQEKERLFSNKALTYSNPKQGVFIAPYELDF
jgi:hypothetical protein